jgi:hypothetical protein
MLALSVPLTRHVFDCSKSRREPDITPHEFPECVKPLPPIGSMVLGTRNRDVNDP